MAPRLRDIINLHRKLLLSLHPQQMTTPGGIFFYQFFFTGRAVTPEDAVQDEEDPKDHAWEEHGSLFVFRKHGGGNITILLILQSFF
jgi:hypothetical protein